MRSICVAVIVVACFTIAGDSVATEQTHADALYTLYVQSTIYPATFDRFVRENLSHFDSSFMSHLAYVQQKLLEQASADIALCNQHTDPYWRQQCVQEKPAAGMYFWCASLKQLLTEDIDWARTWSGSVTIYARDMIDQTMGRGGYEQLVRGALPLVEAQIRAYFR